MTPRLQIRITLPDLHEEINRLRRRDGLEEVGGLGLAHKLYTHFREEHNPRVAEALKNIESRLASPEARTGREIRLPAQ